MRQAHLTENWVYHLQRVGVGGLLVGMMNSKPAAPKYVQIARSLRAHGVGVYTVNSAEVKRQPQGGRWFHVLPLLRTGARVLLSDSDAVWLRDPRPYFRALEAAHPRLDFAVSTDAQFGTDGRRLSADGGGNFLSLNLEGRATVCRGSTSWVSRDCQVCPALRAPAAERARTERALIAVEGSRRRRLGACARGV